MRTRSQISLFASEAEVRIGYSTADSSSASAVGREVLNVRLNWPTTVYGWDLTTTYGRDDEEAILELAKQPVEKMA